MGRRQSSDSRRWPEIRGVLPGSFTIFGYIRYAFGHAAILNTSPHRDLIDTVIAVYDALRMSGTHAPVMRTDEDDAAFKTVWNAALDEYDRRTR